MGLQITKTQPTGVDVTYWKIYKVEADYHNETLLARFYGYTNKTDRDAGKEPVIDGWMNLNMDNVTPGDSILDTAYAKLKATDPFTGSTDVYEEGQP